MLRNHRLRLGLSGAALGVAILCAPAAVRAQNATADTTTSDERMSARLKAEGDELVRARRYEDAIAKYDEAYALSKTPALLYNRGRALQALARYAEALASFRRFVIEAPPELQAKLPGLDELIGELAGRVGRVVVACPVSGARVLIGNRGYGITPLTAPIELNAGRLVVEVLADGYLPYRTELDLAGGTEAELRVELVARPRLDLPAGSPTAPSLIDSEPRGVNLSLPVYGFYGGAVAGVALGTVAGLIALSKNNESIDDCPNGLCRAGGADGVALSKQAVTWAGVSTVSFSVGVLSAGIATYLLLRSPRTRTVSSTTLIVPYGTVNAGGIAVSREF